MSPPARLQSPCRPPLDLQHGQRSASAASQGSVCADWLTSRPAGRPERVDLAGWHPGLACCQARRCAARSGARPPRLLACRMWLRACASTNRPTPPSPQGQRGGVERRRGHQLESAAGGGQGGGGRHHALPRPAARGGQGLGRRHGLARAADTQRGCTPAITCAHWPATCSHMRTRSYTHAHAHHTHTSPLYPTRPRRSTTRWRRCWCSGSRSGRRR